MGFAHWLGGLLDPSGQRRADQAGADLNSTLSPDSPYWQASQLTGDDGILQGAAQLQNANIGVDTSNVDADSAALGNMQGTFAGIAANGGRLTEATKHQAEADLGNTSIANMKAGDRQAAAGVLATDSSERNWAAGGANQSRAQVLANQLKKQTWNTAVSHANFEAALAGQGIENQDSNLSQALALSMNEGANAARQTERGTTNALNQQNLNNTLAIGQAAASAAGQVAGGISGMMDANQSLASGNASTTNDTGYTASPTTQYQAGTTGSAGYAVPSSALGTSFNQSKLAASPTMSSYTSPITGDTVDPNLPTTTASWGDWLTNGSSLVST